MVQLVKIFILNVQIITGYLLVEIKSDLLIKVNLFCQIIIIYFIYTCWLSIIIVLIVYVCYLILSRWYLLTSIHKHLFFFFFSSALWMYFFVHIYYVKKIFHIRTNIIMIIESNQFCVYVPVKDNGM
jgi:hypothetical protein